MKVKAKDGLRVPKETAPTKYITADAVVDVPDSAYYRRRVLEGDLIRQDAEPAAVDAASVADAAGNAKTTAKGA
ncbi:hypothetical protein [Burkholderia perseverans]|uniref:hypothetical protein n=1 Tax=Burkholderia perseverans TaxID=2615214 RepID=UPI001FEF866B|nr:hypothetical protein [Burkholderia perseverans]